MLKQNYKKNFRDGLEIIGIILIGTIGLMMYVDIVFPIVYYFTGSNILLGFVLIIAPILLFFLVFTTIVGVKDE